MSDKSAPFDMFKKQEAGFTEAFVNECGTTFNQHVEIIMNLLNEDEEYDDLDANHYQVKKNSLKEVLRPLKANFNTLTDTHMHFLEEQEKVVYHMCGLEYQNFNYFYKFIETVPYFSEMKETFQGFEKEYNECVEEIDNMVGYEDLNASMYNEYKASFRLHVIGLNARNGMFIDLIMKQHVSNTCDEVNMLHQLYTKITSSIQSAIEQAGGQQEATREAIGYKKDKLGVLIHKISDTNDFYSIIEEMETLEISKTVRKQRNTSSNWESYIKTNQSQLNDVCGRLFELEVAMNALKLRGLVGDLGSIKKLCLTEECRAQIASVTEEMESVLSACLELSKEEEDALKQVMDLVG